ncbi:hypothetical protein [Sphingobium sp. Sx8-8]|uniref:hypothetical protein n=1 Tax=Sphingobium sp. Sx8-8 TaxID=2933617 RepID=UPI001F5A2086|nr:hypothetical protein [Sphingobium sp. Sx8-8]
MARGENQVNVYLTVEEHAAFRLYANKFLLDAAALLALLFARELRVGRLRQLISRDAPPDDPRKAKVTARLNERDRAALMTLAQSQGLKLSQLGGVLVRAELAESWLAHVCTTRFES